MTSTFLTAGPRTRDGDFAQLHLSRNEIISVTLSTTVSASDTQKQGYAEGVVTNTKFGSYPHSTLIGVEWGSQIQASKVDTGSRGKIYPSNDRKRKAKEISTDSPGGSDGSTFKQPVTASSGFIHLLPPTPENWTSSLPHRTQVVYTPDSSYILQRIRARPGSRVIEAGSGSGSFTHAAARAVFDRNSSDKGDDEKGKVFTFEFHEERHKVVHTEMIEHGLDSIVTATHRDVYKDGFWLKTEDGQNMSPRANCIFLDLPAPWEALQHITRANLPEKPSALDPNSPAYICTFSPCIEQVQKTISVMRKQGWLEIEMVEINHKRIDVRRDYTGLKYDGMRGVNAFPATVDEAVADMKEIEEKNKAHRQKNGQKRGGAGGIRESNRQQSALQVYWDEGQLVHRSEPDLKTHTSYLVFAILPREWTEEDEEKAKASKFLLSPRHEQKSQKQLKRESKIRKNVVNGDKTKPVEAPA